jgi:hypothetical protein
MITFEQVMAWKPCYSQERIEELFAGREVLTLEDIFNLDISVEHKLWVLLREELIPAPVLHEFACRVAEQALKWISDPDPRSVAAIAAKRAWLRGEITDEQLREARVSAIILSWPADESLAMFAANASAREAAWSAACVTAQDASRDAAGVANYMSTPNSNLELLKNLLKDSQDGTVYST